MISVACRCSHRWEVPDDQASFSIQCPQCGLLVDVPNLGDIASIDADGTYRLDSLRPSVPDADLDKLTLTYYPGRQTLSGTPIDLRGPSSPINPIPFSTDDAAPIPRPRYDPETGELVQPLRVEETQANPAPAVGPLPVATRTLSYNTSRESLDYYPRGMGVFVALFTPVNVIVMTIIFIMHLLMMAGFLASAVIPFFIVLPAGMFFVLLSHYALVLDEMGPAQRDELPRPLGNVNPFDDLFAPLIHTGGSLLLCYWPVVLILALNFRAAMLDLPLPFPNARDPLLASFIVGGIAFPAVFLTVCTSGTILNLRPDRVLRLMAAIGPIYILFVLFWYILSIVYLLGMIASSAYAAMHWSGKTMVLLTQPFVAYPLLMAGIYFMHAFCWLLGLLYRSRQSSFPWVLQRHTRETTPIIRPSLHPRLEDAQRQAAARAARRHRGIR